MKEKIQIAKMRTVLLYIMQSFPHGVEFIKLFKILYFAQQDYLLKYGKLHYHYRHSKSRKSNKGNGRLYQRKTDSKKCFILKFEDVN